MLCALFVPFVLAHEDDPKATWTHPPVLGPAYRAAVDVDRRAEMGGEYPASGVSLLSLFPPNVFHPDNVGANDCWGYVSPSGREYAIIGLSHGTGFAEITDPDNAAVVGYIAGPQSIWRDIKTYGQYAYAVSEGGSGIQVIDLRNIDSGQVTLVRTVTSGGTTATHNVAIDTTSGYLYRCGGGSSGLRIYNLSNPSNPQYVASWNDLYVHDAQIVTYTSGPYAGRQIAFACSGYNGGMEEPGVDILDVTNKGNIFRVSRFIYPSREYSHQAWLSPDRKYLYLNDELDEQRDDTPTTTRILDVSDLSNPVAISQFTNGNTAIDHNLYTREGMIYEANYTSGIRIFSATDPLNPVEIAYFDTFPNSDVSEFGGLWSNYPYFPSGTVIGSDRARGLFVWRIDAAPISIYFPEGRPTVVSPDGGSIRVDIVAHHGGQLVPGSAVAYCDFGAGFTATPLTPLGGEAFSLDIPPTPCGRGMSFYITAESTSGVVVSSPVQAPGTLFHLFVANPAVVTLSDNFESNGGWTVGAPDDDAYDGLWERVDPVGTAAQPGDDHSASGTRCWVTGQGAFGGDLNAADVDGGKTTLNSPVYDLSGDDDPWVSYWRWFSNNAGARAESGDIFTVDISNDGGADWVRVETVGPTIGGTSGGWVYREFRVADFVLPTDAVRLRFVAHDPAPAAVVEAALDDFMLYDRPCEAACPADLTGDGDVDLADLAILIGNFGMTGAAREDGDLDGDGDVDLADLGPMLSAFGLPCN